MIGSGLNYAVTGFPGGQEVVDGAAAHKWSLRQIDVVLLADHAQQIPLPLPPALPLAVEGAVVLQLVVVGGPAQEEEEGEEEGEEGGEWEKEHWNDSRSGVGDFVFAVVELLPERLELGLVDDFGGVGEGLVEAARQHDESDHEHQRDHLRDYLVESYH